MAPECGAQGGEGRRGVEAASLCIVVGHPQYRVYVSGKGKGRERERAEEPGGAL